MSDDATTVGELRRLVADFVVQRQWQCYHDPKNLAMSVAIEAAELMEHFQWVRNEELGELLERAEARAAIRDEVADVLCYVLALANVLALDLSSALADKMRRNAAKYPVEQFRGRYFKPAGEQRAAAGPTSAPA